MNKKWIFGGGVLALEVADIADQLVGNVAFPVFYSALQKPFTAASPLSSRKPWRAIGFPHWRYTLPPRRFV